MINKMEELIEKQKKWSAPFLFNTNDSTKDNNENEQPVWVDICSVLKRGVPYTFPSHYLGLDSKERLIIELRVAAIKAGFNLTKRSSKSKKELEKSKQYGSVITLTCQKGQLHKVRLKKSASSSSPVLVPKKPRGRPPTNKVKSTGIKYRNKSNPKAKVNPLIKKKPQKCTTTRPTEVDDLCPFGFNLKMYKSDHPDFPGMWCITPKGNYKGTF